MGSQQPCEWATLLLWTSDWKSYVAIATTIVLMAIELIPCGNANVGKLFGFSGASNACLTLFTSLWPLALNKKKIGWFPISVDLGKDNK